MLNTYPINEPMTISVLLQGTHLNPIILLAINNCNMLIGTFGVRSTLFVSESVPTQITVLGRGYRKSPLHGAGLCLRRGGLKTVQRTQKKYTEPYTSSCTGDAGSKNVSHYTLTLKHHQTDIYTCTDKLKANLSRPTQSSLAIYCRRRGGQGDCYRHSYKGKYIHKNNSILLLCCSHFH